MYLLRASAVSREFRGLSIFSRFLLLRSREDEGDAGSCERGGEREKKGDHETAPNRQSRPIVREAGATRKRLHRQWDTESRGQARRQGKRIERSYENKAKPEGGGRYAHATIDTQDRRSNFRSCHSDASWRVPPRLLHAFTHTLADERNAEHASRRAELPGALHIRRDCTSRSASRTAAKRARDGCLPGYYAASPRCPSARVSRNRIVIPQSPPSVYQTYLRLVPKRFRKRQRSFNFSQ